MTYTRERAGLPEVPAPADHGAVLAAGPNAPRVRMWIPCRVCYAWVEAWSYSVPRPTCAACVAITQAVDLALR